MLVLLAGAGVGAWLYATGRLGFGPLSADDEAAAAAVADGVGAPTWAADDVIRCAVDELTEEWRADGLRQRGLVERDGDDWAYTEEWASDDATRYVEEVLDCSDDWSDAVAGEWGLDDPACLEDIDTDALAAYFASEQLPLSDEEEVEPGAADAVAALDECYVADPPAPTAEAEPAYRAVRFTVTPPEAGTGDLVVNVDRGEGWRPLRGTTVKVDTEEGGRRGCITAQAVATFAWGTTATSEAEFCGRSEPRRIWWSRVRGCTASPGCDSWALKYEGFASFDSIRAVYTSNGGDCLSVSGSCSDTVLADVDGRGTIVTWSFPASYDGTFAGRVGPLRAVIPD